MSKGAPLEKTSWTVWF